MNTIRMPWPEGQGAGTSLATAPGRIQWAASGRHHPCPVCGRDTDDKCRWHDGAINCHQGDSFSPPPLRKGDRREIEGRQWAVVSLNGGFSGQAMVFRPHIERQHFTPRQRVARQQQTAAMAPKVIELVNRARRQLHACLGMPSLEELTLAELNAELDHAQRTAEQLAALRRPLVLARREQPQLGRCLDAVTVWQRLVAYQQSDVERFLRVHLGTPTERQIAALEVAR